MLLSYPKQRTSGTSWQEEVSRASPGQGWGWGWELGWEILAHTAAGGSRSRRLSPGRRKALAPRRRFIAEDG